MTQTRTVTAKGLGTLSVFMPCQGDFTIAAAMHQRMCETLMDVVVRARDGKEPEDWQDTVVYCDGACQSGEFVGLHRNLLTGVSSLSMDGEHFHITVTGLYQ